MLLKLDRLTLKVIINPKNIRLKSVPSAPLLVKIKGAKIYV